MPTGFANGTIFTYLILGKEVGPTGTPHLQCYCVLVKAQRLTAMKKLFVRAHLEIAKGTPQQASDYCKKDGDYVEYGLLPLTAAEVSSTRMKKKWDDAWESAKAGRIEDIPSHMRICFYAAFKRIQQDYPVKVDDLDTTCGVWIYGKSGSGKSFAARKDYQPFYDKPLNKWWDGYRGEEYVLLDDVCLKQAVWIGPLLKRWADRYSFPAEQKGTTIQIRPRKVIVTSQHRISELFSGEEYDAISRRFVEHHQRLRVDAFRKYYERSRNVDAVFNADQLIDIPELR